MLVLQRVKSSVTSPSDRPSPTSSGGGSREDDCDKRSALLKDTLAAQNHLVVLPLLMSCVTLQLGI